VLVIARIASSILLALGTADLVVLNLVLAPRLHRTGAAIAEAPRREDPARGRTDLQARDEAPDGRALILATSLGASPTAANDAPPARAMPDVGFAPDSARLDHLPAIHALRRLAQQLRADPDRQILLRGHADARGAPEHNLDLSRQRAEAVREYLVIRGAPADRLVVEAVGSAEPADPHEEPATWARDRRVELLWR
jgi:outer membrane protein OmpA-like peptidoglycan-associated protein